MNSLKFSPDGQWIASAGEEGVVKVLKHSESQKCLFENIIGREK